MAQASWLLRASQPEFWPQAESPARDSSLLRKLEFFIPILHCLIVMLPLYHGFMVGEVHSLLALDFKLGHVTCFDQWVSDEQRLERASLLWLSLPPCTSAIATGRTQAAAVLSVGGPRVRHASELSWTSAWSRASLPSPAKLQTHQCVNMQLAT